MNNSIEVHGYHGTSQTKATSILKNGFLASDNDYDWLGTGIYFFQDAPMRAKQWAIEQHPNEPAVICARIQLDNCIDLFDVKWFPILKNIYNLFSDRYRSANRPLPKQNPLRSKAHRLDCAFFNFASQLISDDEQTVECIRSVFVEGESIFPDSAIFDLAHAQIAVKNPALITEYYLIEI
ncbi:hypothetical protein [Chamaesiphon polymorphus]|uniref:DUF3990 domain-containing protein n=1 Tax=Chamaesiphon polymorphus CCALA 037 TaxID=2107692 RepID=A0A2T1GI01_9CYAN|nr:hypothetical protein [Chamaesiphon polymorphus]PSB57338.1 hypothetical protein C7B77_08710 [Chamaesiphon polymorphus CCALA 037]